MLDEKVFEQIQRHFDARINFVCGKLNEVLQERLQSAPSRSIRLIDIARRLHFDIVGSGEFEISALKFADEAEENDLAVCFNAKEIQRTAAKAVLTAPQLSTAEKIFMYCGFGEVSDALTKVAKVLVEENIYSDYEKPFAQNLSDNSMFGKNFSIGAGTFIAPFVSVGENVTIGRNCKIGANVFIGSGTTIGDGVKILPGSRVGVNAHYHFLSGGKQKSFCGIGRVKIDDGVEIGSNCVIQRGTLSDTIIGAGTIVGNLVEIGHDVKIGKNCLIVSQVGIAGNVTIGDGVQIFGQAGIANFVKVGDRAIILAKSTVTKNIAPGQKVSGMFAREHKSELARLAKLNRVLKEE